MRATAEPRRSRHKHCWLAGAYHAVVMVWLALAAMLLVSGCGASGDSESVERELYQVSPPLEYLEVRWGEQVTIEGVMRVAVEEPRVDGEAQPVEEVEAPLSEPVVLYTMVTIENIGADVLAVDPREFKMVAPSGGGIGGGEGLMTSVEPALLAGNLAPGAQIRGAVPFQVHREDVGGTLWAMFLHHSESIRAHVEWH